jgi:hypothetical protein
VLNGFYAEDLKKDYNKGDKSTVGDGNFYSGEPIWTTAELQGVKSATLFWVGSEAESRTTDEAYDKVYERKKISVAVTRKKKTAIDAISNVVEGKFG